MFNQAAMRTNWLSYSTPHFHSVICLIQSVESVCSSHVPGAVLSNSQINLLRRISWTGAICSHLCLRILNFQTESDNPYLASTNGQSHASGRDIPYSLIFQLVQRCPTRQGSHPGHPGKFQWKTRVVPGPMCDPSPMDHWLFRGQTCSILADLGIIGGIVDA